MSKLQSAMKERRKMQRHSPLATQITGGDRSEARQKSKKSKIHQEETKHVHDKLSRKILDQAQAQQREIAKENERSNGSKSGLNLKSAASQYDLEEEEEPKPYNENDDDELEQNDDESYYESLKVDRGDAMALKAFMNQDQPKRATLADLIMAKFAEKEGEIQAEMTATSQAQANLSMLNPEVIEIYNEVGELLKRYRAGKLPRAFKNIPNCSNWEELLYLTNPEGWSAASVYQATRIFTSNLKSNMAQRFFSLVLYPRVRDDIEEFQKLNIHLYNALKKALFKPDAFVKGILLPLCDSGTCTLREAVIIGSVLSKTSIPMLHSAAALLKMAEMEYTGSTSIFIRILIDKKYALPYRVIDALVFHFLRAENDPRQYPVLWHQSFLSFVERYKSDISNEQKESLLHVLKQQFHPEISPEIRREIMNSTSREDSVEAVQAAQRSQQMQNQYLDSRLFNVIN